LILGGDIGGTKCNLVVFQETEAGALRPLFQRRYATRDFSRFEDLIAHFLEQLAEQAWWNAGVPIRAAGFGVAGAVVEGQLHANNLPWTLNLLELALRLGVSMENIVLLNDVVATAWSLDQLPAADLAVVNQGVLQPRATRALMSVGTGLGEAFLVWDGRQIRVFPSEGGLASFAPRTDREIGLLVYLKERLPHVCCEDVLSGRGIRAIHEFLDAGVRHSSFDEPGADPAREISERATSQSCPVCVRPWICGRKRTAPRRAILRCARWRSAAFTWQEASPRKFSPRCRMESSFGHSATKQSSVRYSRASRSMSC